MTITLAPEQERFVAEKLRQGGYVSPEHLASEALDLLRERDERELQLGSLRRDLDEGWAQAERGELLDGPAAMARLVQRARPAA